MADLKLRGRLWKAADGSPWGTVAHFHGWVLGLICSKTVEGLTYATADKYLKCHICGCALNHDYIPYYIAIPDVPKVDSSAFVCEACAEHLKEAETS
jgi:hypothetical protein